MKKAKEYAEQILAHKDEETLQITIAEVFDSLVNEILEIAKQRKMQTDGALRSIILEQKQKWSAICRIVNKDQPVPILDQDGFIRLLDKVIPMTGYLVNQKK